MARRTKGEINWRRYIKGDPKILRGTPIIKGTHVPVYVILGSLAGGMTVEEVCEQYRVTPGQVRAALAYAAEEWMYELASR